MQMQHPCQGANEALLLLRGGIRLKFLLGTTPPSLSQQLTDYRKYGCFLWKRWVFSQHVCLMKDLPCSHSLGMLLPSGSVTPHSLDACERGREGEKGGVRGTVHKRNNKGRSLTH